jgi:hypothetical protein
MTAVGFTFASRPKMLADLRSGRLSAEQLKGDKLTVLVKQYGTSPNTAKAARLDALSRF